MSGRDWRARSCSTVVHGPWPGRTRVSRAGSGCAPGWTARGPSRSRPARSVRPTPPQKSVSPEKRTPAVDEADAPGRVPGHVDDPERGPADDDLVAVGEEAVRRRRVPGPEEQAELDVIADLEHVRVGGVHGQRDAVLLDDVAVGADVVDVAVGVEDDGRLELQVGDGRDDLLGVGAGVDDGAGARLLAVDEVAVGVQGADDDDLVLHRCPRPHLNRQSSTRVNPAKECYNRAVDALITPEARREIEALTVFRPKPGAWGVLVGHTQGSRFIVEKAFPAGTGRAVPDERPARRARRRLAGTDDRPVRRSARGRVPEGRPGPGLVRQARPPSRPARLGRRSSVRPSSSSIGGFFLDPIGLAPAVKEEARE
ncbi:MAG: hypothetical protein MZV63_64835 [Marinilabiliales bacterium]|nr:hypothetical protein [Marinilabiliales bacterium]